MKKYLSKILLSASLLGLVSSGSLFAQCVTAGFGQYPSGTFTPNPCNVSTTITTCAYDGEYSLVNLTAGNSYQFTMNYGDYITIANSSNVAQVWGVTPVTFNCTVSGVYRMYRHLDASCGESSALCRTATVMQVPGVNDACAGAIAIVPGIYTGNTGCATVDAVALCGTATVPNAGGLWYKYTPSCSGTITASLCTGTAYNSQISVFDGTCGALNCIAGNDDFCATQSEATWAGAAGTTYYILVHGNASTGNYTLNLSQQDLTAPVADMASLPPITSTCGVTLTAPTATDNCAGAITGTTPQMYYNINGVYNVVWTYNDGNGNTSTQTQSVTVNDVTGPVSFLPNDTTLSADLSACCATYYFAVDSGAVIEQFGNFIEDGWNNSGLYNAADDFQVPAGASWDINVVTFDALSLSLPSSIDVYFYDDAGGYPGTVLYSENIPSGSFTSTVSGFAFGYTNYHYEMSPTVPVNVTGGASGATYWIAFQINGAGTGTYWEESSLGTYGSNALQVYGPIATANWAGPYVNTTAGDLVWSLVTYGDQLFVDACGDPVTIVQNTGSASGSCFNVGTTTNSYTATDVNGNSTTDSFTITVNDDENPTPSLDSNAVYNFSSTTLPAAIVDAGTMMDSVLISGVPTPLSSGDLSSVCIDIQHSYDGDLTITLISPQGTLYVLSANNGGADDDYISTCFDMNAAMNINAGGAPFVGSFKPEGPGGFDVFNGEDPNGYWKIMIDDNTAGDAGALMEFHVNFDYHWEDLLPSVHSGCGTVTTPTATDNCGSTITGTTSDPVAFTDDGTYNITWTYTDAAGNTTTQTQEVIIDDITPPVPTVASIPPSTGSCSVTIESTPTATDGCTGTIIGTTTDATTYNVVGTYTITWSYDDGNGNISTQTQTLSVTDTQDPVPSQPILPNVVGNCSVTVSTIPTATDNCSVGTINGTTTDPLTYNVVGTFFIIWTYTDVNGNTHTQNQTVVVNPCLGIEDESGQWNALVYPNPGSGIFTVSLSEVPSENTEVKLVDGLGQVLYSGILQNQVQQFDFSHLASATYYLLITNNNGHISKPVIIRHNY